MEGQMPDSLFMWLMLMGEVEYREDARKIMMAQGTYSHRYDDVSDEFFNRFPEGGTGFGYGDLALAAIRSERLKSVLEVSVVNKARKKRADDTPALKSRLEDLLLEVVLCADKAAREAMQQEINRIHDELEGSKNSSAKWDDFFAADNYADKIRILQELYRGGLTPAEILDFLYIRDDDKETVMQEIQRAVKEK